jgi:hypothetical protein
MFWNTKATQMCATSDLESNINPKNMSVQVGFEIIAVVTMQSATLQDVIMCSTVEVH